MYRRLVEKFKGKKIFRSMFVACFGLAAVCILCASIWGFLWFERTQIEKEKQNYDSMLYASSLMLEDYVRAMQDTMEVLRNDTYLKKQMTKKEFLWDKEMAAAAGQIKNLVMAHGAFHSIYVIKDGDYLIKCTNASYAMNLAADQSLIEAFYESKFGDLQMIYYLDPNQESRKILALTEGEQNPRTRDKENGILIGLDIDRVMRQILPEQREGEQYLLTDEENNVLYAMGGELAASEREWKERLQRYFVEEEGSRARQSKLMEGERGKYLISRVSMKNGFCLIHILPYKYIGATIDHMRNTFLMIGALLAVLLVLVAFAMSYWVYSPIDAVVKTTSVEEAAPREAYDRLAQNELTSIARTYHAMVETLNDLNAKKDQEELARYLGSKSAQKVLPEWVEETYGKEGIWCRALCFRISDMKDLHDNNTDEAILFEMQTIMNVISQVLKPLGDILVLPADREYIAVLIFSQDSVEETALEEKIQEIFNITGDLVRIGMDAGISDEKADFAELASMYQMARAATAYRFIYGLNAVITENQMAEKALTKKEQVEIRQLAEYLKEGSRTGFWKEYDRIIAALKEHSLQTARETLINMAAQLLKYKNSLSYIFTPLTGADYESLNNELLQYEYIDDVRSWFVAMVDEIWSILDRARLNGRDDIADRALEYLQENYADPNISAQYLADMYHITPSYFSRLFNERSGCAFPDYLSTLRIEKAKEILLKDDKKSIQEICELVGYSNSSYFTALFKKKYGITPGQFRKNHQNFEEN